MCSRQLKLLDVKKSLETRDNSIQIAIQKSAEREALTEIAKLEQELEQLRVRREDRETRRFKKRYNDELEISKKYFSEGGKQPEIPILDEDMLDTVDNVWQPGPNTLLIESKRGHECRRTDVATLRGKFRVGVSSGSYFNGHVLGRTWLNDEVINFYFGLMMDRADDDDSLPSIHAFSTFFYPKVAKQGHSSVKRWTRKVDLFSKDRVLFPIHLGVHWTLAAAIMADKEIVYLDSMGGSNEKCQKVLLTYLQEEHELRKKAPLPDEWTTRSLSSDIPQQNNSSDCGVFCCKFGDYIARGLLQFNFKPDDMQTFRKATCYEIVTGKLLF